MSYEVKIFKDGKEVYSQILEDIETIRSPYPVYTSIQDEQDLKLSYCRNYQLLLPVEEITLNLIKGK